MRCLADLYIFRALTRAAGDERAEAILRQAASEVGFKEIQFAYEPVAAAMEFERSLRQEQLVLVVDIGGGTSDISLIRLGPDRMQQLDRSADLLGHAGRRIGGVDMDIKLAIYGLMPLLGRGSQANQAGHCPIPYLVMRSILLISRRRENLYRPQTASDISALIKQAADPSAVSRLQQLYQQHLSYYLVQGAEQAKIALAKQQQTTVSLQRLEADLQQTLSLEQLDQAIYIELNGIRKLIEHSLASAGSKPDCIFLTGGASAAKGVVAVLQSLLPDVPLIRGDRFGSVGKGLCSIAARIYG